ncbi:acyltransferase [Thermoflexus sp.]|uniref:acyltransferase n=1 Tax=Thermoflexus sp. TaxID=1969742 RepID=UPI002ADDDE09|nr:acyltransferase [Thermoflexus sp.]
MAIRIHPTAEVSTDAEIGDGTVIWHHAQIREGARIGVHCTIGKGVYIDAGVVIGDNVKIQNYVSIYRGVIIEDGVFIGPHVCFTNDIFPRAIRPDGSLKTEEDWVVIKTLVRRGASIGANSTIRCGVTIGEWAMVGAGSVVTREVPPYGLVYGNPARLRGFVCPCGAKLRTVRQTSEHIIAQCPQNHFQIAIPASNWKAAMSPSR